MKEMHRAKSAVQLGEIPGFHDLSLWNSNAFPASSNWEALLSFGVQILYGVSLCRHDELSHWPKRWTPSLAPLLSLDVGLAQSSNPLTMWLHLLVTSSHLQVIYRPAISCFISIRKHNYHSRKSKDCWSFVLETEDKKEMSFIMP